MSGVSWSRTAALLFTSISYISGCTAIVDATRAQCASDADCTARGAAFASTMCVESECRAIDPWSCADHAPLAAKSSAKVPVDFSLFDAVTSKPVVGLDAALCGQLDVECANPIDRAESDADGVVRFEIMPLFAGFVLLEREGYDPSLLFLPPSVEAVSLGAVPITAVGTAVALGLTLGKELKPGTGRVLLPIVGCDKRPVSGVAIAGENMDSDAVTFYSLGGVPTFTAPATDESGFAGFFNVEPGPLTIHARFDEDGQHEARVGLFVRPDYSSIRRIQPWTD